MPHQQNQYGQPVQPQFTWEGGHLIMYHKEATGLPQVKDPTVNDRDRMQDILSTEKYLTDSYTKAMNEAGHDALVQVLKQNFDDCQQAQRQVFNTMFKKGWYKLPVADAQSVTSAYNQFQQYRAQFPFQSQQQQQQAGASAGGSIGQQQLDRQVNQAIQQTQQGQIPSINMQAGTTGITGQMQGQPQMQAQATGITGTAGTATAGGQQPDQQLNQKVDQAIREAERGRVPGGYTAPGRSRH